MERLGLLIILFLIVYRRECSNTDLDLEPLLLIVHTSIHYTCSAEACSGAAFVDEDMYAYGETVWSCLLSALLSWIGFDRMI